MNRLNKGIFCAAAAAAILGCSLIAAEPYRVPVSERSTRALRAYATYEACVVRAQEYAAEHALPAPHGYCVIPGRRIAAPPAAARNDEGGQALPVGRGSAEPRQTNGRPYEGEIVRTQETGFCVIPGRRIAAAPAEPRNDEGGQALPVGRGSAEPRPTNGRPYEAEIVRTASYRQIRIPARKADILEKAEENAGNDQVNTEPRPTNGRPCEGEITGPAENAVNQAREGRIAAAPAGPRNDEGEAPEGARYLGQYKITGYDICVHCCGKTDGITASGTQATVGRTCAAPPDIPFGTRIWIAGIGERVVEDRGGLGSSKIDVLCADHPACYAITTEGKVSVWILED